MIYLEGRKVKLNVFKTAPKFDEIIVYNDSRRSDGGSQPATNKNRTNHLSAPVSERQGMKEDDEVPQDKKSKMEQQEKTGEKSRRKNKKSWGWFSREEKERERDDGEQVNVVSCWNT